MSRWTILSRNERHMVHGDHSYFAARCRPGVPWHIEKLDRPTIAGSRCIGTVATGLTTREVTKWAQKCPDRTPKW